MIQGIKLLTGDNSDYAKMKATKSLELSRTFKLRDPQQRCPSGCFCLWPRRPVIRWCCRFTCLLASVVPATSLEVLSFILHKARGLLRAYTLYERQQAWLPMASTKSREALESLVMVFESTVMRKRVTRGTFWAFPSIEGQSPAHSSKKNKKLRLFPTSTICIFRHSVNMYWISE